jgi:hypothetical protein
MLASRGHGRHNALVTCNLAYPGPIAGARGAPRRTMQFCGHVAQLVYDDLLSIHFRAEESHGETGELGAVAGNQLPEGSAIPSPCPFHQGTIRLLAGRHAFGDYHRRHGDRHESRDISST